METELGKYIVIEGHDGTGKSTQVERIRSKLGKIGIQSAEFHEPGGEPTADEIRKIIKNGNLDRDGEVNILLFTAARRRLWKTIAQTALDNGEWVVTSRNYWSTIAYQGYGEGTNLNLIEDTTEKYVGKKYMNPDIAVILDLDDEQERLKRIGNRGKLENPDTFESKDDIFQSKVREGYLKIAHNRNIPIVSASQTVDKVTDEIWQYLEPYIK